MACHPIKLEINVGWGQLRTSGRGNQLFCNVWKLRELDDSWDQGTRDKTWGRFQLPLKVHLGPLSVGWMSRDRSPVSRLDLGVLRFEINPFNCRSLSLLTTEMGIMITCTFPQDSWGRRDADNSNARDGF